MYFNMLHCISHDYYASTLIGTRTLRGVLLRWPLGVGQPDVAQQSTNLEVGKSLKIASC